MKQQGHPTYGSVVFRDRSAGTAFLTRSTIVDRLTPGHQQIVWSDGVGYPVVDVEVSSASHPFWTGRGRVVDSEGRVDRFRRRYKARSPHDQVGAEDADRGGRKQEGGR